MIVTQTFRIALMNPPCFMRYERGTIIDDPAILAEIVAANNPIGATATAVMRLPFAVGDTLTTTINGEAFVYTVTAADMLHATGLAGSDQSMRDISGRMAAAINADPIAGALVTAAPDKAVGGLFLRTIAAGAATNAITFAASTTSAKGTYTAAQSAFNGGSDCMYLSDLPADELGLSPQLANTMRGGQAS